MYSLSNNEKWRFESLENHSVRTQFDSQPCSMDLIQESTMNIKNHLKRNNCELHENIPPFLVRSIIAYF